MSKVKLWMRTMMAAGPTKMIKHKKKCTQMKVSRG